MMEVLAIIGVVLICTAGATAALVGAGYLLMLWNHRKD